MVLGKAFCTPAGTQVKQTKTLTLTNEELEALWELGRYVLHPRRVSDDPATRPLRSLMAKVRRQVNEILCRRCQQRPSRKLGLCDRCYMAERRASA